MTKPYDILIVDDEPALRSMLSAYLSRQGFNVRTAVDGQEFNRQWQEQPADLILLDVNMPGEDGVTLTRRLHKDKVKAGIILVTAVDMPAMRIEALTGGADDYITKPFEPRELLARVRSVLRRTEHLRRGSNGEDDSKVIRFGSCQVDLTGRRLLASDGQEVPLTAMEFDLLVTFVRHPNQILSRDQLSQLAHSRALQPGDRSIDTRITRLRHKLYSAQPQDLLKTIKGEGYLYEAPAGVQS